VPVRVQLLNRLADLYDADNLNDASQLETTLRDLLQLQPEDTVPLYRLADSQEKQEQFEAAEHTLMSAKQLPITEEE
jgi:hypothetical protein